MNLPERETESLLTTSKRNRNGKMNAMNTRSSQRIEESQPMNPVFDPL